MEAKLKFVERLVESHDPFTGHLRGIDVVGRAGTLQLRLDDKATVALGEALIRKIHGLDGDAVAIDGGWVTISGDWITIPVEQVAYETLAAKSQGEIYDFLYGVSDEGI